MGVWGSWAEAATAQLPEGHQTGSAQNSAPSLPLHLYQERGDAGAQDGSSNPHPGEDTQMTSVELALHAQAHLWLRAQESWSHWTSFHLPQISSPPHCGKGKAQLRHRKVWCVLMGCVREDGKPLPSLKLGAKRGTTSYIW